MEILLPLAITAFLIAMNGLFVAAEFAIIGASRTAIERQAQRGSRLAAVVLMIVRDPRRQDRYIATAQVGITFATLGLGMYSEHQFAVWIYSGLDGLGRFQWLASHAIASVIAIAIMTYFHIVLGEMVPKSLALQRAERTAILISTPMTIMGYVFYPFVFALNGLGNILLRLVGIDRRRGGEDQYYSQDELALIIRESLEGGMIRGEAGQVVSELLEFTDLTAGEVMVPRVRIRGIPLGSNALQLRDVMRESPHGRYPVYQNDLDHIVGMLQAKQLLRLVRDGGIVEETDLKPLRYIPETTRLGGVLSALREDSTQMVVVMDEHGGTNGLITIEDLFEELVGELDEERGAPQLQQPDGDGFRADGTVRLEDVGDELGIELEHEEVDTVSGLVLMLLDRPPIVGDSVEYNGLIFEVTAVEGHGVRECLIRRFPSTR
jgi:CBS domain containing-hemolysin-like protein